MTPRFDPIPIRKMRPACFTQGAFFAEVSAEGPAVDVKAEAARPERLKSPGRRPFRLSFLSEQKIFNKSLLYYFVILNHLLSQSYVL